MAQMDRTMSLMDRAQARKQNQELLDMKRKTLEDQQARQTALAPLVQANERAKLAKVGSELMNSKRVADLRTQLESDSVQAEAEWADVMQYSDPETQAREAVKWTGKWMKFSAVNDFAPLWKQRKEIAGQFMTHALDLRKIDANLEAGIEKTQAGIDATRKNLQDLYGGHKPGDTIPLIGDDGAPLTGVTAVLTDKGLRVVNLPKTALVALAEPEIVEKDGVKFYRTMRGGELRPLSTHDQRGTGGSGADDDPDMAAAKHVIGVRPSAATSASNPKRVRVSLDSLK